MSQSWTEFQVFQVIRSMVRSMVWESSLTMILLMRSAVWWDTLDMRRNAKNSIAFELPRLIYNNQRPDISMINPKRSENLPHVRLILDVGITCPVHPASHLQLTRDQSNTVARACNTYHTTKMNKYSSVADANQLCFLPLIIIIIIII